MIDSIIIHDLRSVHNVGSILRSCEGFGVSKIYIGGTSPYPRVNDDARLPHIIEKQTNQISKTALGAEKSLNIMHYLDLHSLISQIKKETMLVALEQIPGSINLKDFTLEDSVCLLIGREVKGIDPELLELCDKIVEISMKGHKESYNVAVATGIALYQLNG